MSIGENIKSIRKQKKLTQFALGEISKLSRSYIADIERDRYNPSLDTLQTIANALGVSVSTIIGEEQQSNKNCVFNGEELTEDEIRIMESALMQYREMKKIAKKEADNN